jgi:hypothetical protein
MLFRVGDLWRYRGRPALPPTEGPFDSAWPRTTGIGYGDGDDATVVAMREPT